MALSVQTNIGALSAERYLSANQDMMNKGIQRLSSGFRINSAADDAAGYAIASKLSAQGSRLQAASQNASQASAMVQMADASINQIQNMITQIQSLATQAASANNSSDIAKLEAQRVKLENQITKIANSTNFNGTNLLNGEDSTAASYASQASVASQAQFAGRTSVTTASAASIASQASVASRTSVASNVNHASVASQASQASVASAASVAAGTARTSVASQVSVAAQASYTAGHAAYTSNLSFQVGASNSSNDQVNIDLKNSYTAVALGLSGGGTPVLTSQANAQAYITIANTALDSLVSNRAALGATVNQLSYVNASLSTSIEQVSSAVSTIKDANMATEMANFTKSQILVQTGTAMLSQANRSSQNIMSLFR